ncbi:MAG: hypothetical protein ABIG37_00275 [Nanoarchaeota archaeon]
MNFQFYMEKLRASEVFKEFMKGNSSAFLCSCFFSVDLVEKDNRIHFDYYVPSSKQMFSFQLEKDCEKVLIETREDFLPEKISEKIDFNLNEIERALIKRMKADKIQEKVQKIFISLQRANNKDKLIGTIFISAMGMISFEIELSSRKIISFQKKSFLDFFRILKK